MKTSKILLTGLLLSALAISSPALANRPDRDHRDDRDAPAQFQPAAPAPKQMAQTPYHAKPEKVREVVQTRQPDHHHHQRNHHKDRDDDRGSRWHRPVVTTYYQPAPTPVVYVQQPWTPPRPTYVTYHQPSSNVQVIQRFDDRHRDYIRSYMRDMYRPHCPPGLAKKGRHCAPPVSSTYYVVGGYLPQYYQPVPVILQRRLPPPPVGTYYAMVDNDVLLVASATHMILDAVTLLSALN